MNTLNINTLTETQQHIVNSIVKEFNTINTPPSVASDDLIAYIKGKVNEKQLLYDETRLTNEAYEKAGREKADAIIKQMNDVLDPFGYFAYLDYSSDINGSDIIDYHCIEIKWNGHLTQHGNAEKTRMFFYTNTATSDGIRYLVDSSLVIYKNYPKQNQIYSVESLLKYVAELVIEKQKSLIQ